MNPSTFSETLALNNWPCSIKDGPGDKAEGKVEFFGGAVDNRSRGLFGKVVLHHLHDHTPDCKHRPSRGFAQIQSQSIIKHTQ